MVEVRIHQRVFDAYPDFRRGIVMATGMDNQGHSDELEPMLQEAVAGAADHPIDLKGDPRTVVWTEAHRRFNSNPNKFPPAHCALLKRVQKPGARIPFINKVVAVLFEKGIGFALLPDGAGRPVTRIYSQAIA